MAERLLNPKQELFLSLYTDPKSETFSNALQSALKAGYAQEYSESITSQLPDWLSESLGNMDRLRRAEKVLDKVIDMETSMEGKEDSSLVKAQLDAAKFVASTVGKKIYSTRHEHTGPDGKDLPTPILNAVLSDNSPTQSSSPE